MTADEVADLLNLRELLWDRKGPTPDVGAAQVLAWHAALVDVPNDFMTEAVTRLARIDDWPSGIARICETREAIEARALAAEADARAIGAAEVVPCSPEVAKEHLERLRTQLAEARREAANEP